MNTETETQTEKEVFYAFREKVELEIDDRVHDELESFEGFLETYMYGWTVGMFREQEKFSVWITIVLLAVSLFGLIFRFPIESIMPLLVVAALLVFKCIKSRMDVYRTFLATVPDLESIKVFLKEHGDPEDIIPVDDIANHHNMIEMQRAHCSYDDHGITGLSDDDFRELLIKITVHYEGQKKLRLFAGNIKQQLRPSLFKEIGFMIAKISCP